MKILMLICEIIIGLAGIYTIIAAKDLHDRMHGVLVVLLCMDGLCEHFFWHYAPVTEAMLIITATYALFFIIFFSSQDIVHRSRWLKNKIKDKKEKSETE